jgi:1-acyl-sn-glycerol-3-phosphate acyltransferase
MSQFLGNSPVDTTTREAAAPRAAASSEPNAPAARRQHEFLPIVDGVYRTAPRRVGWLSRTFPSLLFYPRFFSVVFRGAAQAKRRRYDGRDWSLSSLGVLRALEAVGCQVEMTGLEHLEQLTGPVVFAGNHMSTLETAVLPVVIQPLREVTFVVKQSLVDYPVFKHIMRSRNPVALTQSNPRADLKTTLTEGAERLSRGVSVVVFPEGTRLRGFDPERFNTIAVKLAARAGVPIVPFALMTDAWAIGKRIPDLGVIRPERKVHFAFGPPMTVDGRGAEQQQALIDFIAGHLAAWKAEGGHSDAGIEDSAPGRDV